MEVYVRFNGDADHDYAFQINEDDTVKTKIEPIFTDTSKTGLGNLMVLRPTIFHKRVPSKFYKSNHPGYLSEGACLLFDNDADYPQYLVDLDESKPLIKQLWPGQLIVPQWEYSPFNVIVYTSLMLLWLYTDLPDMISPTPGICLSNQISRYLVLPFMEMYGLPDMTQKLKDEITVNYNTPLAQIAFFVLHVIKVAIISLVLKLGIGNPISFNPIKIFQTRIINLNDPTLKKTLFNIGWMGARRAGFYDYQPNYYNYIMKKYGGPVAAYKANKLRTAARPGLVLAEGEGFQTPLKDRFTNSTFKTMEEKKKFVLSEEYYIELEKNLKENIDLCEGDIGKMNNEIRRFRRFGLYEVSPKLRQLVLDRKSVEPEAIIDGLPAPTKPDTKEEKKEK
ncbi:hypothetical protein TPHA_0O00540 [Tetrapisispora phaffii CBS 4417]|uniref:Uncharacterized protein n=1 Tax=Tetrapisispora phaffii (strain ATCC 24235 / CBS 4417 / NBRC 1672 / NRRL Y-8282 / UCD 70-5) TaxID=1071381 RepID=G8C1J6_TETPH|nr:hypothetical protein TPHA_0O00540 [Tetrapisispora phaffii CBS 4417]CCE66024.1 hypothetical protein TPHA_0O00540 [Tetrapisispora phaffii CBS 4417]